MIINKKPKKTIEIDLTGYQGNSFYLLGTAKKLSLQIGLDSKKIIKEMQAGDYDNLIKVFDNYFGDFVILYR
jgi:hypothetical protein